jgi:tRNA(fMet)-specific endonuclease VapC
VSFLLDTNTCIAWLNGTSKHVQRKMASSSAAEVGICSVVKAELIYGARKSTKMELNLRRLDAFFAAIESLAFDDTAADYYGSARAFLEKNGTPIGPHDLMIAAIALAHRRTVVTRNESEFRRVPNLHVESWH